MNAVAAMQAGVGFGSLTIQECLKALGDQFAFLLGSSSSQKGAAVKRESLHEIAKEILGALDQFVVQAIRTKSVADFRKVRELNFPEYYGAVRTLSGIARVLLSEQVLPVRVEESFSRVETLIKTQGDVFGENVREQALFTLWIFRKIDHLIADILRTPAPKRSQELDIKFAQDFAFNVLWARFHLECLTASLDSNIRLSQEVLDEIMDGLRAAVNAHAHAKQGAKLRRPATEIELAMPAWDEEDQALLDSSMRDLQKEHID